MPHSGLTAGRLPVYCVYQVNRDTGLVLSLGMQAVVFSLVQRMDRCRACMARWWGDAGDKGTVYEQLHMGERGERRSF